MLSQRAREYMTDGLTDFGIAKEICDAIDAGNAKGAFTLTKTISLSSDQLLNLYTIPVDAIAPVSDGIIYVMACELSYFFPTVGGVPYTIPAGAANINIQYTTGQIFINPPVYGILDQTHNVDFAVTAGYSQPLFKNVGVNLVFAGSGALTSGDGTLAIKIFYQILK